MPIIPFSPEMPELSGVVPPFVFYGYTTLILNAFHSPVWRSGVFYDPAHFRPSAYQAHWGRDQMISPFEFATLRELNYWWNEPVSEPLFVKPDDDLKRFSGGVMDYPEFSAWFTSIESLEDGDVSPETSVAFCPPSDLGPEFRVFLVEGKPVASSSYLPHGGLVVPPEVMEYAERMATIWQPAPVFVLDVAYVLSDAINPLRVVEANCFNGSAFYQADVGAIVRHVSQYQEAVNGV